MKLFLIFGGFSLVLLGSAFTKNANDFGESHTGNSFLTAAILMGTGIICMILGGVAFL